MSRFKLSLISLLVCIVVGVTIQASKPVSKLPLISSKVVGSKAGASQNEIVGQRRKVVDQGVAYATQPVKITDLKINGKTAALNVGNDADTDWLNGLSWKIKNTSQKNIVTMNIYVCFPDAKLDGRLLVYSMNYGTDPKIPGSTGTTMLLKPNETADFVITDDIYKGLKPLLEARAKLTDINHVRIKLELVVFDDDTAWGSGQVMRRDPNNPRAFDPIE